MGKIEVYNTEFKGFYDMERSWKKITQKIERTANRKIVRKALRPMVKAARNNVNVRSGQLKRSLGVKVKTYKGKHLVQGMVGARRGFNIIADDGTRIDPANYSHLLEFGTKFMAPSPYLRPAFDSTADEVLQIYSDNIGDEIINEANKVKKKGNLPA